MREGLFERTRDALPRFIARDGMVVRVLASPGADPFAVAGEVVPCSMQTASRMQGAAPADPRVDGSYSWEDVRPLRDALLAKTDYVVLSDAPFSGQQKAAWRLYRDALRDMTDDPRGPCATPWPEPPQA